MLRKLFRDSRTFFASNADKLAKSNWAIMRQMSLVYLGCLVVYLAAVCLPMGAQAQTGAVITAIAAQLVFVAVVFTRKRAPRENTVVSTYLGVFGLMILLLTLLIDTVIFPNRCAVLFPLMIILMGQIYILKPTQNYLTFTLAAAIFLFLSGVTKTGECFGWDVISTLVAVSIAVVAYTTSLAHHITADQLRGDLERMLVLDPVTGVMTDSSFEYRYNDYCRSYNQSACALAIAELTDKELLEERYGTQIEEAALAILAESISETFTDGQYQVGASDQSGFVVLIKDVSEGGALERGFAAIRAQFAAKCMERLGIRLDIRVGAVMSSQPSAPFRDMFIQADQALDMSEDGKDGWFGLSQYSDADRLRPLMLIADPDANVRKQLRGWFRGEFHMLEAATGKAALHCMNRFSSELSVALLDTRLKDSDGDSVFESAFNAGLMRGITVLALSASNTSENNLHERGVTGFILKPLEEKGARAAVDFARQRSSQNIGV